MELVNEGWNCTQELVVECYMVSLGILQPIGICTTLHKSVGHWDCYDSVHRRCPNSGNM